MFLELVSNPPLLKTLSWRFWLGFGDPFAPRERWESDDLLRIWTMDSDGLVIAGQIGYLRLDDVVEWSSEKNLVRDLAHDLGLQIDDDSGEKERDVVGDAEREVALCVC